MSVFRTAIVGFGLAVAAASPARAQAPLSLTLDDAIARAIEYAPRLAEAKARQAAAEATVGSRAALGKPTVSSQAGFLRTNHVEPFSVIQAGRIVEVFPDVPSNYNVRGQLTVPVYTAGRVDGLVDAARADVRAATADASVTEQDIRLEVTRAYWSVVTAAEAERVLVQGVERADAAVSDVKARVDAGLLPPNDLLSAQAQRAREFVRLVQARNAVSTSAMQLARLIGEDPARAILPATSVDRALPAIAEIAAQPTDVLLKRALERRGERGSLAERQAGLRASGTAALAAMRPQVGATASIEPSRPNPRWVPRTDEWRLSWDVGIGVTWSLFDGGKAKADNAVALAQAEALGHRLSDFDSSVAVAIRQSLLNLEAGRAALEASVEAVTAATEARRVVEERFRAGVATSTDVLDAQLVLLEAELERTRIAASMRISEAELVRAIGGL